MDIMIHSQNVLDFLKKDALARVSEAEANLAEAEARPNAKGKTERIKLCKESVAECNGALTQIENQTNQNKTELLRLTLNVELFDKRIKELSQ